MTQYTIPLEQLGIDDVAMVGGKNASLGEMIANLSEAGVSVPGGFATTAAAYREFLSQSGLDQRIQQALSELDTNDVARLAETGKQIRQWILDTPFPADFEQSIDQAFAQLEQVYGQQVSWAVRSSATAEDLPDASFAGQQETFLNVSGLDNIKHAIH
ncbi:MAG: PEP/pyruvate-binding domain-containing protein, partial [Chromatiales bacterium]